jgi:protein O-GlcNAc transferase
VPGSVLWLLEDNQKATANLRNEAAARGVAPERLVFARRAPLPEHLARHRLADLFLDTLPYNAHTTASDALWAGLPVLTLMGRAFQGRVAASLLRAVGLPELVTTTSEAFEVLALDLAEHPEKLAALKGKLAANRLTAPLFDIARFTRDIERAYFKMYDRYQSDLPPEHFDVPAEPALPA